MVTKEVGISGAVGKQVYYVASGAISAGTRPVILRGLSMFPKTSAASVTIRDGNASGTTVINYSAVANDSNSLVFPGKGLPFDKGMHVKVLGTTGALCYLFID